MGKCYLTKYILNNGMHQYMFFYIEQKYKTILAITLNASLMHVLGRAIALIMMQMCRKEFILLLFLMHGIYSNRRKQQFL